MKIISNLFLVAVLVSISVVASAIEESEKIKVTAILKTQESWDGKQIDYPEGKAEVKRSMFFIMGVMLVRCL